MMRWSLLVPCVLAVAQCQMYHSQTYPYSPSQYPEPMPYPTPAPAYPSSYPMMHSAAPYSPPAKPYTPSYTPGYTAPYTPSYAQPKPEYPMHEAPMMHDMPMHDMPMHDMSMKDIHMKDMSMKDMSMHEMPMHDPMMPAVSALPMRKAAYPMAPPAYPAYPQPAPYQPAMTEPYMPMTHAYKPRMADQYPTPMAPAYPTATYPHDAMMMDKPMSMAKEEEPQHLGRFMNARNMVEGDIFKLNEHTLYIQGFSFDGKAPDVYFYSDGTTIPYYTRSNSEVRTRVEMMHKEDVVLLLPPEKPLNVLRHFMVWCRMYNVNFGDFSI